MMKLTNRSFAMEHFNPNAPLSAVDPADVQAVWRLILKASPGSANPIGEAQGAEECAPNTSIGIGLIAQNCSAGADVYAVFFRASLLGQVFRQGLLSPWQQDGDLSPVVFQVIATIPAGSLQGFDTEAFLSRLRDMSDVH
jgi:hypothetical protein